MRKAVAKNVVGLTQPKSDYTKIDYGMPRTYAFAVGSDGGEYDTFKDNLVAGLKWYVPGIPVVNVDMDEVVTLIRGVNYRNVSRFAKLAVPIMEKFKRYDRVIWVDSDIDIRSSMFAGVLSVDTGEDGIAMAAYSSQNNALNAGVVVFDLYKIDKASWSEKINDGVSSCIEGRLKHGSQVVLNTFFNPIEMDGIYNSAWNDQGIKDKNPSAVHYCGKNGRKELYGMLTSDPVDAVFVIGTGSRNNNEELRYALRNLDAHCRFVRNVYICGECPDWVDKSAVIHIEWPDRFHHAKDANIIDKLRHACEHHGIAKRILFCSDDQFQTRDCSWEDFCPRHLRIYNPNDKWYDEKKRVWHTRLKKTLERDFKRREEAGLDTGSVCYWQPHMWMQIDRDKFIEYAKWSDYEHRTDTIIASGYFNYINQKPRQNYDHVFIGGGEKEMPDVLHIAYSDGGYKKAMSFLKEMLPEKCRFEVDS